MTATTLSPRAVDSTLLQLMAEAARSHQGVGINSPAHLLHLSRNLVRQRGDVIQHDAWVGPCIDKFKTGLHYAAYMSSLSPGPYSAIYAFESRRQAEATADFVATLAETLP